MSALLLPDLTNLNLFVRLLGTALILGAVVETLTKEITLAEQYIEDRRFFGRRTQILLDEIDEIEHGYRMAVSIRSKSGAVVGIPQLLGNTSEIERRITERLNQRGVHFRIT